MAAPFPTARELAGLTGAPSALSEETAEPIVDLWNRGVLVAGIAAREGVTPATSHKAVIASSAPASGRSPWMKRAIRLSIHSGRLSRDEPLHHFSFSVRKLPLGCFGTSLLAMTIQLDRRPLSAGANGGGIKAPSKPFSKLLQNSRVSLQAFPNKALAVLWDFKRLQGFQTSFDAFQIFRL